MSLKRIGLSLAGIAASLLAACSPETPASGKTLSPLDLSEAAVAAADEFLWLEEISSPRSTAWVDEQNARTKAVLEADPRYPGLRADALAILTAEDRIAQPSFRGMGIDNFWQDASHVRGVWRHAKEADYLRGAPQWRTVLDIDALAEAEGANWIFKGADCLPPEDRYCLVSLSNGGKDAVVVREYDTARLSFRDEGFHLPEAKHRLARLDDDRLLLASDFGAGTLTESGYPFVIREVRRGEEVASGREMFRGEAGDGGYGVSPLVYRNDRSETVAVLALRPLDTFRSEIWDLSGAEPVRLNLPERVSVRDAMQVGEEVRLVFSVEQDWNAGGRTFPAGALIAAPLSDLRAGLSPEAARDSLVLAPGPRQSFDEVAVFDGRIVVSLYDNVRGSPVVLTVPAAGEEIWSRQALPASDNASVHLGAASRSAGRLFYTHEGFLTPPTLSLADVRTGSGRVVRQAPARFDASGHVVEQFEAVSSDGEKIPYFVVRPGGPPKADTPTQMFGYGGFQLSYPPSYRAELGKLWLERGGAYVLANIRGGGEFGPAWHQAALKAARQTAFDDFAAVAADLAARGITSAPHLAVYGRSNGGVLTSVTLTQHPELIGGAVIESPLVDMLRYHALPPGASWIGEYGDPRIPEEAAFIATYSAYQALEAGKAYPEVYITTNTHDDRVHPGHARKFAARLQSLGYPALYHETTDGGHSNDSDPVLNADRWARHYTYLARRLGLGVGSDG